MLLDSCSLYNRKNILGGVALLLLLGGVTILVINKELKGQHILEILSSVSLIWLIPALISMSIFILAEGVNIWRTLKLMGYQTRFISGVKYAFSGFFFSSITPSASGGQPAQLFFMSRDGVKAAHGTLALITELFSFEIAMALWGVIGAVISPSLFNSSFGWIFAIGFALNFVTLTLLWIIMFSDKLSRVIAGIVIRIAKGKKQKILRTIAEYRKAAALLKEGHYLWTIIGTSVIQVTAYVSIPFFCLSALGITSLHWLMAAGVQGLIFMSISSLPMPGGSGAFEMAFSAILGSAMTGAMMGSTIILIRMVNFILPLIACGIGILLCKDRIY